MTKIVKGGKSYPFITGDDVIITKGVKHPGKTVDETIEEVDTILDEHQKEIDKLKSNLKYVYSYGGVGGKGSGGSGSGTSTNAVPFASLNKRQLKSDGSSIILNGKGSYTVDMSVSNSQGKTFLVEVLYGKRTRPDNFTLSTERNKCKESYNITLNENGEIIVRFYDEDGIQIAEFAQFYIVNPHTFDTKFMYEFNNGINISDVEFSSYEYFVGNTSFSNPFLYAEYQIDVQNVSNVSITYSISGTTFDTIPMEGTKNSVKIKLDDIVLNGKPLTHEDNTGTYTVSITLSYISNATEQTSDTKSFDITIVPNHLYINVRNAQNLIYDTISDIRSAIDSGIGGIPEKSLNVGTYTSFYCKVFEGSMVKAPERYNVTVKAYDVTMGHEPGEEVIGTDEIITPVNRIVTEQQENSEPISTVFSTTGVKMLVFSTKGVKDDVPDGEPTIKYIYVKERSSSINEWYPNGLAQRDFYFKANLGNPYSENFPVLPSGTEPLEINESGNQITISNEAWGGNEIQGKETTILSFGIQYSTVNKENSVILNTYSSVSSVNPDITLYSDKFYSKNIFIPTESNFNKTVSSNYHLVQIVRHKIGYINVSTPQWATYLYIDGKLEANNSVPDNNQLVIKKIVFNNVNIIYNLINLQYIQLEIPDAIKADRTSAKNTIDGLIYQYYLAYKDIMGVGEVTEAESKIFDELGSIKFDGTDVIVNTDFLTSVSPTMPIPTLMMEYTNNDESLLEEFKDRLFRGYRDNDSLSFGTRDLTKLWWCNGSKVNNSTLKEVIIPQYNDNSESYNGIWQVKLQGTSTMKNRIKNFSLILKTDDETIHTKRLLVSPNYSPDDPTTFLPEQVWTLKADIADSAHANNTSIGRFVNRVCTRFSDTLSIDSSVSPYIKNTLEGFPVLMYFKIGTDVYYLGVYNFNMGRESYYNLGYIKSDDLVSMKEHIHISADKDLPFSYSVGSGIMVDGLAIGEVQDNNAEFDYHQYQHSVLFNDGDGNDGKSTMFGKDSKITGDLGLAKQTLENFVKSVSLAGAYCFANIGKKPKSSKSDNSNNCVNRYELETDPETGKYIECVPDIHYQFRYNGTNKEWFETDYTFDNIKTNDDNLLQCISSVDSQNIQRPDFHYLDFKSVSEYYTICMAFGLVDSILKNQNIKSWDGKKCYVAFYDMDCALGEDNAGKETITYLAATDYWYSESKNGYLEPVEVKYDYWNSQLGSGFDYPSSYLFAIAKYAQAILGGQERYPQQFWAEMRQKDGELRNANHFIENYFSSGIGEIPAYMASLNYQVKYLYKGKYLGADNEEREGFLANQEQFNGTRIEKVKDWLNKRFHFLDVIFNIQAIDYPIGNGDYKLPKAIDEVLGRLSDDVIILSDAFTIDENSNVHTNSIDVPVDIIAPKNTPFIANRGKEYFVYILNAETGVNNRIMVNTTKTQSSRFLGSTEFISVSKIEPFLNTSNKISSNKLEEIIYSGLYIPQTTVEFTINSTSMKNIQFNIPTFKGTLTIANDGLNGQALQSLNISESGLTGTYDHLSSLKRINIASINSPGGTISVYNCPLMGDGYSIISGLSDDKPTTLSTLSLLGVTGNLTINHTSIETISLSIKDGESSEFSISGDTKLRELNLTGFKSIVIRDCPNLDKLTITEGEINKCEKIIINIPDYQNEDGTRPEGLKKFKSQIDGVFDFSSFNNLKVFGLTGSKAVNIKMPNCKVSIDSLQNNKNLEFVDTPGQNSVIELTKGSTFYNCPRYGMRQSWWSTDDGYTNGKNISTDEYSINPNNARVGNYTRMCVSPDCTTLGHTFDKVNTSIVSEYLTDSGTPYHNSWGQYVYNKKISLEDAQYFINYLVAGAKLDDEYIDDENIIHDTPGQGKKPFGQKCCKNIESLQGLFNMQDGISYGGSPSITVPDLSEFTSLTNISMMYYGTKITFISASLLSLPESLNNNEDLYNEEVSDHTLIWTDFLSSSNELKISRNAFKNISYRITNLTMMNLSIYGTDTVTGNHYLYLVNTDDGDYLDIVDILCPHIHDNTTSFKTFTREEEGETVVYDAFERFTSFYYFNVNGSQYVDYTNLFNACPNTTTLMGFLNNDLSRSKIDGILKDCKKLEVVDLSFRHNGSIEDAPDIDLYDFFNWGDPNDVANSLFGIKNLFTSNTNEVGFAVRKHISNEHFKEILGLLHNYKNIERLSNLFSFCTIEDYDGFEIKLGNLEEGEVMDKIKNVNGLFYNCSGNGTALNIGRSFFECLPNIQQAAFTFGNVEFSHMLTYDFFCKRRYTTVSTGIYVVVDPSKEEQDRNRYSPRDGAVLHTIGYDSKIYNLNSCFMGAKFINCECWFDHESDENEALKPAKDWVEYNGSTDYDEYYIFKNNKFIKYSIKDPVECLDVKNNFTNYVEAININLSGGTVIVINNHDIIQDLGEYGNTYKSPFDSDMISELNISPTYCCLPPDLLHCCYYECDLTNVFADTNIIGVIPQHLIKECYNSKLYNMFRNVNILPNLIYHYDSKLVEPVWDDPHYDEKHQKYVDYLEMIKYVPIDNETITIPTDDDNKEYILVGSTPNDATVLFRNSDGELRRRYPFDNNENVEEGYARTKDYNKSQFVYVPQGYTTNRNLDQAFTFRYNLPAQVDLHKSKLDAEDITWPSSETGYYDSGYSPDNHPELWPYYTQYFFTIDESVSWDTLYNMNAPFINDGQDVSFVPDQDGIYQTRIFSANEFGNDNRWWGKVEFVNNANWDLFTNGIFNVFLNLCGKRNMRTGIFTDYGCPLKKALDRNVSINSFLSGILIIFLNGRVFEETLDAGNLNSYNGSVIIDYSYGFSRNIIFPNINTVINNHPQVLLWFSNNNVTFYKYMFPSNSYNNYVTIYGDKLASKVVDTTTKYIVRKN